jgi:hypothetical protein
MKSESENTITETELIFEQKREKALSYFQLNSGQEEDQNDFIIDAILSHQQRSTTQTNLFFRIISSPVILIILIIALTKSLLFFMRDYLMYGGELIAYRESNSLKKIDDLYKLIIKDKKLDNVESDA